MVSIGNVQNQVKKLDARVRKRKAGPIRKDYIFKRSYSDSSRPSTPATSTSTCPSPAASISSYGSDYEDESMSDASSISGDDGDPNRLVMSFDFNEEEKFESDFPLNGYVRNFINGMSEESASNNAQQNATVHGSELISTTNMNHTTPVLNNSHMLTMNSNGSLTVPGVPTSPPNSPQHPYISNYGNPALSVPTTNQLMNTQQQTLMQEPIPPYMNATNIVVPTNGVIYYPQQHLNGGYSHVMSPLVNNSPMNAATAVNVNASIPTTQMSLYNVVHMQQQPMHQQLPTPSVTLPIQHQQQLQAQFNVMQHTTLQTQPTLQQHSGITTVQQQQQQQQPLQQLAATTTTTILPQAQPQQQQQQQQTQLQHINAMPQQQQQQQQSQPQQTHLHNDINDAQEISRILQQSYNNGNSSNNNNNNNNNNSNNNVHDTDIELMPPPMPNTTINHQNSIQTNNVWEQQIKIYNNNNNVENGISQLTNSLNNVNSQRLTINQQQQQQQQQGSIKMIQQKVVPATLTEEQRDEARRNNLYVRSLIFRDIRRPGRNYTQLLDHLNLLKGDLEMKSHFVDMCIYESQRFRRQQMAKSIESWWEHNKKLTNSAQITLTSS